MVVQVARDNEVLTLQLARKHAKNSLDVATIVALRAALSEHRRDAPRAIVLTSALPGVFSLGMDLLALQDAAIRDVRADEIRHACHSWVQLLQSLVTAPCPTFAWVSGAAVAGGVDLLAACDVVIAGTDATFAIPQLRKGIFPLTTSALLVPRIGQSAFVHWMISGQFYSATRARQIGLVSEVVASDELPSRGAALVRRLEHIDAFALGLGMEVLRGERALQVSARLQETIAALTLNCVAVIDSRRRS